METAGEGRGAPVTALPKAGAPTTPGTRGEAGPAWGWGWLGSGRFQGTLGAGGGQSVTVPRRSPPRPTLPVKKAPWRAHHPRSAAPSPAPHLTEAAEWPGGSGRPARLLVLRVQVLAAGPRPCGHLAASSGTSRGRGAAVRGCSGVWLSRCSSVSAGDFTTGRSPGPGAASEHQSRELRGCARVLARVRAATGHRRPAAPPGARHPGLSTALPAAPPRAPPPNTTGTRSHRSRGAVPLRLVSVQSRTWGASLPTLCPQPPGGSHGSCPPPPPALCVRMCVWWAGGSGPLHGGA